MPTCMYWLSLPWWFSWALDLFWFLDLIWKWMVLHFMLKRQIHVYVWFMNHPCAATILSSFWNFIYQYHLDIIASNLYVLISNVFFLVISSVWWYIIGQVIAATNRADILDPALMRSGRLDRKIEFPHPSEEARARILQVGFQNLWCLIS